MFKILIQQLKDNGYDNHIYFDLTNSEIENLKQLLKNNYGYIDIIINFEDLGKLNNLINSIPKDLDKDLLKSYIYEQYLIYKILKESHINDENIRITPSKLENILFNGNFEKFKNMDFIMYMFLEQSLKKQYKNTKTRLHLFLDEINDILLQKKINDLIYVRQSLILMCYTTKDKLLSHTTMDGNYIESPHDYRSFYQKKKKI